MKIINGWNEFNRQVDKFEFGLRFGWLTVFDVYIDVSRRDWSVTALNFTFTK